MTFASRLEAPPARRVMSLEVNFGMEERLSQAEGLIATLLEQFKEQQSELEILRRCVRPGLVRIMEHRVRFEQLWASQPGSGSVIGDLDVNSLSNICMFVSEELPVAALNLGACTSHLRTALDGVYEGGLSAFAAYYRNDLAKYYRPAPTAGRRLLEDEGQ